MRRPPDDAALKELVALQGVGGRGEASAPPRRQPANVSCPQKCQPKEVRSKSLNWHQCGQALASGCVRRGEAERRSGHLPARKTGPKEAREEGCCAGGAGG